jgi:hypothetical protein
MKKEKEVELVAIMFKVPQSAKEALRMEAKRQTALRGYKVTMTALFAEWMASMRQTA